MSNNCKKITRHFLSNMYTRTELCQMCLLCLKSNENLRNILSPDSDGILVEEKLKFFMFKFVNIEPEVSKHVCVHCLQNVNYIYNFKRQCALNVSQFNRFLLTLKDKENLQVSQVNIQENNINNSTLIKTESINSNLSEENNELQQSKHKQSTEHNEEILGIEDIAVKIEPEVIYSSDDDNDLQEDNIICGRKNKTLADDEPKYEIEQIILRQDPEDTEEFYDEFDPNSEYDDDSIDSIQQTTNNAEYFPSSNIKPRRNAAKVHTCTECHKTFKYHVNLTIHKRIHTGEKPFKCKICDKAFNQKVHLQTHNLIHSGKKPYKCNLCQKTFVQKVQLEYHKYSHTGEKPYKCDMCEKSFRHPYTLGHHKRMHTNVIEYKCEKCNKIFTEKSSLTRHRRTHSENKPYKCDLCDKAFKQNIHLVFHKNSHTGAKPYKCPMCEKAFGDKSSITRHIRIHTGERPYECDVCHKRFNQRSALVTHKLIHTRGKTAASASAT